MTTRTRGGHRPTGTAAERRATTGIAAVGKSQRTRDEVLAAARRCFVRYGYAGTTVEHIVEVAGLSRGSFYTYFESKAHVFERLVAEIDRRIADQVATLSPTAKGSAYDNLLRSNTNYLAAVAANADLYRLVDEMAAHDPDVARNRLKSHRHHIDRVADTIRRWQRTGRADKTFDAELTAAALVAMLSGYARWTLIDGDPTDHTDAAERLTDIWAMACGLERPRQV
jgi:AcrR family transcriptional regulator